MAFFKFRLPGQPTSESQGNPSNTPAESVDVMRRRARHRLIGASVLVIVGVVGFPLLFDTQPRPVSVDIAVDIPDRATAKPLVDTSKQKPLSATAGLDAKEEVVPDAKPETKPEAKPVTKPADSKDTGARFVVQVGTFSDDGKLREVRSKLEKAGITTYTQVIEGKEGRRVRVRVGPFTNRDEADKAVRKIKPLSLQPQVLTL
jgi:DedD protein